MTLKIPHIFKIKGYFTAETLFDLAFILFFSYEFFVIALSFVGIPKSMGTVIVLCIIYGITFIGFIYKQKSIPKDFFVIFLLCVTFFGFTYLLNPENEYWYTRASFGFWDYVFKPSNAIYSYLFLRLMNDPKRIMKNLKFSSWIMYIFLGKQVFDALRLGYWLTINDAGQQIHSPYNLAFGYTTLFCLLPFLYGAITEKNKVDIIGAGVGIVMILLGGSRGPLACIAIFIFLYALNLFRESRKKLVITSVVFILFIIIWCLSDYIILAILDIMEELDIQSRTLTMLLTGDIDNDNGRNEIWASALNMIKENPFGYGAMGARPVLYVHHVAGHSHNIALEMMIDFGVFVGGALLVFFGWNSIKILFVNKYKDWSGVFLVFFASACQLLMSACYWGSLGFWGCIAVGYMAVKNKKHSKIILKFGKKSSITLN